jgi:hypothetical protein
MCFERDRRPWTLRVSAAACLSLSLEPGYERTSPLCVSPRTVDAIGAAEARARGVETGFGVTFCG